jgi:hypothetical protein
MSNETNVTEFLIKKHPKELDRVKRELVVNNSIDFFRGLGDEELEFMHHFLSYEFEDKELMFLKDFVIGV